MSCNKDCNQGRDCDCELPITMEDEPLMTFETVMNYIVTLLAGVGIASSILITAFIVGYTK